MRMAIFLLTALVSFAGFAKNPCEELLTDMSADLFVEHDKAKKANSSFALNWKNKKFIKALEGQPYEEQITIDQAYKLLEELDSLPLLCENDKPMGVCFARSYYTHMRLLQMGVKKEQILKVWAVGPHSTGDGENWMYHVAILVPIKGFGWRIIDASVPERIYSLSLWYSKFNSVSDGHSLKLFITKAAKLGPVTGKYDRKQMGLDLDEDKDIYKGYFKQLNELIAEFNKDTSRPDSTK